MSQQTDVLVIGAGPYGVAVGEALWHRGVEVVVAGRPFELWHRHTLAGMSLRSDARASEIPSPARRYSIDPWLPSDGASTQLPVARFRRYLEAVAGRLPFDRVPDLVELLSPAAGSGFEALFVGGRRLRARRVVLATGLGAHAHVPPPLRRLPPEILCHTWQAQTIDALSGRRVLVLGAGQSAAESVGRLREGNEVVWCTRKEPFFFREPLRVPAPLFRVLMASADIVSRLPPAVTRGIGRLLVRTTITPDLEGVYRDPWVRTVRGEADEIGRGDSSRPIALGRERFDFLVSATGYRYRLENLDFVAPELRQCLGPPDRAPWVDSRFHSRVPGLYVVGGMTESTFGPSMRFLIGARHTARRLGAALAEG